MKIGIYSPYFTTLGGGERYMLTIAESLQDDHEVDLFCDDHTYKQKAKERLQIVLDRVRLVPNIFSNSTPFVQRLLVASSYDSIFILSDGSIPVLISKKNILHFQQPIVGIPSPSWITKLKLSFFPLCIVNSKFTKRHIDALFGTNAWVLYPPVHHEEFTSKKKKNIIVSVGRFHPIKKQKYLIEAFQLFHQKTHGWKLIFIGGLLSQDKEYLQELVKQAKDLPIQLVPNASFAVLKETLAEARFYWHAAGYGENESLHPDRMEHFGIAPLEAMAASCIPFVYDGGGLPEIINHGENGYLWKTPTELVDLTEKLIMDNQRQQIMITRAKNSSKQYSAEKFSHTLQTLMKKL